MVSTEEGLHSFAALRYRHELVCLGFDFVSQASSLLFEDVSDRRPIISMMGVPKNLMELGHTVADEVFDLLNSRHGCQETPLSSEGVVRRHELEFAD